MSQLTGTWEIVDGVNRAKVLAGLLDPFFVEEVKAGVAVELDVEFVGGGLIGFEEEGLVLLVDYEQVV